MKRWLVPLLLASACAAPRAPGASKPERFAGDHIPLKAAVEVLPGDHLPLTDLLPAGMRPRVPSQRGDPDVRILGDGRPEVFGSRPVDYEALPRATVSTVSAADAATVMVSAPGARQIVFSESLIGQLEIGRFRAASQVPVHTPNAGSANPCGARSEVSGKTATWEGIVPATWSAHELDYVRHEGAFDGGSCKGVARRSVRVRARAIIPSLVYAYRECVGSCAEGAASSEEMLVLIGPPSSWLTSSAPWPSEQLSPHVGVLSRARVPLGRGGSASVLMNTNHWVVRNFVARYGGVAEDPDSGSALLAQVRVLQLGFDALWPSADPGPSGVAFLGSVTSGNMALLESLGVPANPY